MKKKALKHKKQLLIIGVMAVVAVVLAVIFFSEEGREKEKIKAPAKKPSAASTQAKETASPARKNVSVYFLSEEDGLLHAEEREIAADPSVIREATETLEELIKGSQKGYIATLPPKTKLRQIFLTKDGTATVDFSREFVDNHPSGTSAEMATIYSVVNSLARNFPSIKQVLFLVEGAEKETLAGHINLSKPFKAVPTMVAE